MTRALAVTALAVAGLAAAPAGAVAAPTCDLSGSLLEVSLAASGDQVSMGAASDGQIVVIPAAGAPLSCTGGAPTTANTNTISVHNAPGSSNNRLVILDPSAFAPGATAEPGDDEIEIFVNLNNGGNSRLDLFAAQPSEDHIVLGTGGINANASGFEDQPDADIVHNGSTAVVAVEGVGGPDFISAQGGRGTGGPVTTRLELHGGDDNDFLEGGNGPDVLFGSAGADVVFGFGGDDLVDGGREVNTALAGGDGDDQVVPGSEADPVDGGPGNDALHYASIGTGVSASLQGTNVETLNGTQFDDVLIGTDGPDEINGFDGGDEIGGRGGADRIDGGSGPDSLQLRDGVKDTAECGPGIDSITTDAPGIDDLSGCELLGFPPPPDPGGGGPGTVPPAAFGSRTLVSLTLARKRIRPRRPVPVRVRNANGFAVTGTLSANARRRRIEARPFTVAPNARTTVRLRLPTAHARRRGRLTVRLKATVRDPARTRRVVRKTVALRLSRRVR